jgi:hypothetical protein
MQPILGAGVRMGNPKENNLPAAEPPQSPGLAADPSLHNRASPMSSPASQLIENKALAGMHPSVRVRGRFDITGHVNSHLGDLIIKKAINIKDQFVVASLLAEKWENSAYRGAESQRDYELAVKRIANIERGEVKQSLERLAAKIARRSGTPASVPA